MESKAKILKDKCVGCMLLLALLYDLSSKANIDSLEYGNGKNMV